MIESGQITIWLISIFGDTTAIAQVGALGRVSVILTILTSLFSTLFIPRFAREKNEYKRLFKHFVLSLVVLITVCSFVVLCVFLFSSQLLWILGENYKGLDLALTLNVIGSCLALITGILFSLCSSRGWLINPYIYILINIFCIVLGILVFDISNLIGVLHFNIFISVIQMILYFGYAQFKIHKVKVDLV